MPEERSQSIDQFRRIIAIRYKLYGRIAGLTLVSGIVLAVFSDTIPYGQAIASCLSGLGMIFLYYTFHHRHQMLFHFNARYDDAHIRLEKYFEGKQKRWEDSYIFMLVAMCLLGLTMLSLLFFSKDSVWTGITSSLFISLILALSLKGWMDFNDSILLHDIRRSIRDQPSE